MKPSLAWGALIGGVLMFPLLAISYLGQQAARLAYVPYDLFDWTGRILPAPLIQFGRGAIEEVVAALQFGNSSDNAKTVENIAGSILALVVGALAGALFFLLMNRLKAEKTSPIPGVALALLTGVPFALFSLAVNVETKADPLPNVLWVVALFGLWGWAVGWAYQRLSPAPASTETQMKLQTIDRRSFLVQMGGAAAAVTVVGAGLANMLNSTVAEDDGAAVAPEATVQVQRAVQANYTEDLQAAAGTRAEVTALRDHYRIDIVSNPAGIPINPVGYTLPFISRINNEAGDIAVFTLDDIRNNFEAVESYITMSCVSNRVGGDLISTIKWTGARMKDILDSMDVPPSATHLKIYGGDDFDETVAIDLIMNDPRVLLAYSWEDQPLPNDHGFPLRMHIPDLYGMKQPKWITRIEFLATDEDGYWVRRGWDKVARVRATSVIDTVAVDSAYTDAAGGMFVPVGGIAWAGARGISSVEVRVDGGEWQQAQLRAPISDRTWNIWRYDWQFTEGAHTFEVRCFENDGTPQIDAREDVRPSGATGIHGVRQTISGIMALTQVPPPI